MTRALSAAFVIACACVISTPADANFWEHDQPRQYRVHHHKPVHRTRRSYRRAPEPQRTPIVIEPIREDVGPICASRMIDVVSTGHQTIGTAKEAAQTAWRAKVQMLVGGIYMDPTLSEDERWLCTIADPRDTISGKFSEATAKLSGNDGEIYRCYYAARPCRANVQRFGH